jgi:membrane associated rhomboid family serine protease
MSDDQTSARQSAVLRKEPAARGVEAGGDMHDSPDHGRWVPPGAPLTPSPSGAGRLPDALPSFPFADPAALDRARAEAIERAERWNRAIERPAYGTWALLAVCLAMFGWESLAGGSTNTAVLLRLGADYAPLVKQGQWWRMFTSAFLHIGWIHLAFNMVALYSVAPACEKIYGTWRFLALYAVSAASGSLFSDHFVTAVSAGASGALFGVFGAVAVLGWRLSDVISPDLRKTLTGRMVPLIAYNLLFGATVGGVGSMMINNAAHVGGLIGGVVFTFLVPSILERRQWPLLNPLWMLIGAVPFVVQGWLVFHALRPFDSGSYHRLTYRSSVCSFEYPSLLALKEEDDEHALFLGGGVFLVVTRTSLRQEISMRAVTDADLLEVARAQSIKNAKVTAPVEAGGRRWLTVEGSVAPNRSLMAFTLVKRNSYVVLILYSPGARDSAVAVLDQVLATFQPGP